MLRHEVFVAATTSSVDRFVRALPYLCDNYERLGHTRLGLRPPCSLLQGGFYIVPIFSYGVSRTLTVCPGFDNWVARGLSRKVRPKPLTVV